MKLVLFGAQSRSLTPPRRRSARLLASIGAVGAASLAFAAPAGATIASVFNTAVAPNVATPITCTVQTGTPATEGQRWCQGAAEPGGWPYASIQNTVPSTVASFDGTPLDVSVALPPAPASGPDGNFPVVGVYHGYGSAKLSLSDANTVQRWVSQGYAVFTITDRGFWGSCGPFVNYTAPACANGYIHLMSNEYEVHDAQYMLGLLADDGVINPQKIGASGGSYGGGISMMLATLKNRVENTDGTLSPWTSPLGKPMQIAAAAPEYAWSDLQASLMPNGSTLDYTSANPYLGPNGDHRIGSQKLLWNQQLYGGGAQAGKYAAAGTTSIADITNWYTYNSNNTGVIGAGYAVPGTGGPYDNTAPAAVQTSDAQQLAEFPKHAAYYTDSSVAPAPMLISNGWDDDLFPVSEGLRMYNKIRTLHPDTPVNFYGLDLGHTPRSGNPGLAVLGLWAGESAWFAKYVKGDTSAQVTNPDGGVWLNNSACTGTTVTAGTWHQATDWASVARGEVRVDGAAQQTVAPGTAPSTAYQDSGTTVCTDGPSTATAGAASYSTAPATGSGYEIAGSPTVVADLGVVGSNDQLVSRLYDVDPSTSTQKLIGRAVYRPTGVGSTSRQVFQISPQNWVVAPGHVVKLELLSSDVPFVRDATGQNPVTVSNLQLRLPTLDAAGAADGQVQSRSAEVVPAGYSLTPDVVAADAAATPTPTPTPAATPSVPIAPNPAATDPLTVSAVMAALKKAPKSVKFAKGAKSLAFTDQVPEAGVVTYKLSVDVKKGKHTHRYTLGTVTKTVATASSVKVTVTVTKNRRALANAHRKGTFVLATSFVSAVSHSHVASTRKVHAK